MTAPQLVKEWNRIVNGNVVMGRDAKLLKEFLDQGSANPVQIVLGMYQWEGNKLVTIPFFLKVYGQWMVYDDTEAEIELATLVTKKIPPAYYTWKELKDEDGAWAFTQASEARVTLREWANRILE